MFESIHTEHLALDKVRMSRCCYFHCGYRITNLILKSPHNHNADILNSSVKLDINIYNELNNIYSSNKSLSHHSNKIYFQASNLVNIILTHIVKSYIDEKG